MLSFNAADYEKSGLIDGFRWDFQQIGILPKCLSLEEIDPMLFQVALTFPLIELENKHGIKNIPFLFTPQAFDISINTN